MSSQHSTFRITHTTVFLVVWMAAFLAVGLIGSYIVFVNVRETVGNWETTGPFQPVPTRKPSVASAGSTPAPSEVILPEWQGKERVNILLLGIDQRDIEQGPWRTDTMILVTVDPATKSAGMLSIPRDVWVTIPGYQESRINNAHFFGDATNYPGGGPALAKKTVQQNIGLPVHYYVRFNFTAFEKLVDLIGGIDVQVERAIDDDQYPDSNYGYEPFRIDAGLQHLDGKTALKYARSRYADPLGDFGRAHRQQQVILAVRNKLVSGNTLAQLLPRAGEIASTLGSALQTDLNLEQALALAKLGTQIDVKNIKQAYIDQTMTLPFTTPDNDQVLIPLRDETRKVVASLVALPGAPEAPARIVVQNGTVIAGLAGQTAELLRAKGFNVVQYGNTDDNRSVYTQTQILVYTNRTATAQSLAEALQVPASAVQAASGSNGVDIKVILGTDYRPAAPVSSSSTITR